MEWEPLAFILCSMIFTTWLMMITQRLGKSIGIIEESDDRLNEITEAVNIVATLLSKLPELMPQYTVNQGEGIMEKVISQLFGFDATNLSAATQPRDAAGRYADGTNTQEIEITTTPPSDGESPSSS